MNARLARLLACCGDMFSSNGERGSALALFLIRSELRLVGTQAYSGFDAHWGWPGRGDALKDAADEDQYRAAGRQRA